MPKIMYVPQHKQRLNQVKKEKKQNIEVEVRRYDSKSDRDGSKRV